MWAVSTRLVLALLVEMSFKGEITHLVPNELYAFKVVEDPFHYTGTYRFKPHPEGTWIEWVFEAEPGSFGVLPPALLKRWCSPSSKRCRQSSSIGSKG